MDNLSLSEIYILNVFSWMICARLWAWIYEYETTRALLALDFENEK